MSRLPKRTRLGQMESQGEIAAIHKPLIRFLRENKLLFVYHRPEKRSGIATGWPDFTICHCGRCLLIEAKKENGKLSEKQVECVVKLRTNGNPVKIVRSASEAISAVEGWMGVINAGKAKLERLRAGSEEDSEYPLDEGSAPSNGLSGLQAEEPSTAQNLWIADIRNALWVMSGDHRPGGLAKMVRRATMKDIQTLPRR